MAINQQITVLPDAPNRLDRDNFATDMHAFFIGMQAMTVELETFRGEANTTAAGVNTDVTAGVTARTAAQTAQTAAEAAQTAAENAGNASKWASYSASEGDVRWSPTDGQSYRNTTGSGGTTDPANDSTNWARISGGEIPVGGVYIDADTDANPSLKLGYGTWVSLGAGRVLVGIDSGDSDFDTMGETGGAKSVMLNHNELPPLRACNHPVEALNIPSYPAVPHNFTYYVTGNEIIGNNVPHNNVQPYLVVAIWKRTA